MCNIHRQYSGLKYLKNNLKEDEIILSADFPKNYDSKQFHEIQSAYFGHEALTLYTTACYHKSEEYIYTSDDKDSGLKVLSVVIVSNRTVHE